MRAGLIILTTAAAIGAAAISAPASADPYHDGYRHGGEHRGWNGHDRWDRHDGWRRDYWRHEREREWRWHHRGPEYGYNGYSGRGYYR